MIKNFVIGITVSVVSALCYILPHVVPLLGNEGLPAYKINEVQRKYFDSYDFVNTGALSEQALTTLSASPASSSAILLVILATLSVMVFMQKCLILSIGNFISIGLTILLGNLFLLLQIDDLPDEGYVWASKVDNFIRSGQLGVSLDAGRMGESTVGFLQFLLAAAPRALGLTIEQSLYVPLWVSLSVSQVLLFSIVAKHTNSKFYSHLAIGLVFALPVLGANFALAFDNVMAYAFLVIWLFFELNASKVRKDKARILLVAVLPLIRLDLVIVSLSIITLHLIENKLFSIRNFVKEVQKNRLNYAFSLGVLVFWLLYKLWAFGDLVPAMATYKGFHAGADNILYMQGLHYLIAALNLEVLLSPIPVAIFIILLVRIYSWKWRNKILTKEIIHLYSKRTRQQSILLDLSILFLFVTSAFAFTAGGDYFGPQLMRYQFPFLILIALLMYLKLFTFSIVLVEKYSGLNKSVNRYLRLDVQVMLAFSLFIFLLFFRPNTPQMVFNDINHIDQNGRVTCEAAAAISLKKAFDGVDTVASSEVNGFAYHSNASLIDLIALVDTRTMSDGYVGDARHKFRIISNKNEISRTDVLWLHGGAECAEFENLLTPEDQYAERLYVLATGFPANFRVINFSGYIDQEFRPQVIEYSFYSNGKKFIGRSYTFTSLN